MVKMDMKEIAETNHKHCKVFATEHEWAKFTSRINSALIFCPICGNLPSAKIVKLPFDFVRSDSPYVVGITLRKKVLCTVHFERQDESELPIHVSEILNILAEDFENKQEEENMKPTKGTEKQTNKAKVKKSAVEQLAEREGKSVGQVEAELNNPPKTKPAKVATEGKTAIILAILKDKSGVKTADYIKQANAKKTLKAGDKGWLRKAKILGWVDVNGIMVLKGEAPKVPKKTAEKPKKEAKTAEPAKGTGVTLTVTKKKPKKAEKEVIEEDDEDFDIAD